MAVQGGQITGAGVEKSLLGGFHPTRVSSNLIADPLNQYRPALMDELMRGLRKSQKPDYSHYNSLRASGPYKASPYRINTGPIWSQQQINQQVNAGTANIRANTQNDINSMYANMGARGFASRSSPLAMALEIQSRGMGNMGAANLDRDTRWSAAEGNARHVLAAETAQGDLYARADATNAQSQGQFWSMLADAWNGARNSPNVSSYLQAINNLFGQGENYTIKSIATSAQNGMPTKPPLYV